MNKETEIDKQLGKKRKKKSNATQHGINIIDKIGGHLTKHCVPIFWFCLIFIVIAVISFICYGLWCYFHIEANKLETQQRFDDFKVWFLFSIGCFTRFLKINQSKEK